MKSILVLSLLLDVAGSGSRVMAQSTGMFTATGAMTRARSGHTATLLANGKVLIAGGQSVPAPTAPGLASAELYDPSTEAFTACGAMTTPRVAHTATLLADGRVLIAGGYGFISAGQSSDDLSSAEVYDPTSGTFASIGVMTKPRLWHTATLLGNGTVLIAGGRHAGSSAELYDPVTGKFMPTGSMTVAREQHIATLLPNGKVLIVPGGGGSSITAEIYDPEAGVFNATDWKEDFAIAATANLLPNGKVLVTLNAEGCDAPGNLAALYDPSAGVFTATLNMSIGICRPSGTFLPDGTVLVAGGWFNSAAASQIYDPAAGAFSRSGNMTVERHNHTATLLNDGNVLITGGAHAVGSGLDLSSFQGVFLASGELYHPAVMVPAPVLFSLSGDGRGAGAIRHSGTRQIVSASDPTSAGEVLEVYGAGLIEGGVIPPQVAIGGRMAEILYFGKAPEFAGMNQVNVRVPSGVESGPAVPVRLTYLARTSNEVRIGVR